MATSQIIQTDPRLEQRRQLALAMMQQGQNAAPVQHWTQGANRIAQSLLGAYQARQAEQAQAEQQSMGREALAQAMQQLQAPSQPMTAGEPGDEMAFDLGQPKADASAIQRFAQTLASNPYTSDYGTQLGLQDTLQQQQMAQQMAMRGMGQGSKLQDQKELAEFKAQLAQKYPKPKSEFEQYLQTLQAEKMQADIAKKAEENRQAQVGKEAEQYNVQAAADALSGLVTHPGFDSIYGSVQGVMPTLRQESVNAEAIRDNLSNILTLAARGQLKGQGQITEGETKMLKDAQTILSNSRIDEPTALAEAGRVLTYLAGKGADIDTGLLQQLSGGGQLQGRRSGRSDLRQPNETPSMDITTPQSQADYDALPSGAIFIDPDDGKQYRKP